MKVISEMAFSFESINTRPEERFRDSSGPVTDGPKRMINNSSPRHGPTINHTFIRHGPQLTAVFFRYFRIYHAWPNVKENIYFIDVSTLRDVVLYKQSENTSNF